MPASPATSRLTPCRILSPHDTAASQLCLPGHIAADDPGKAGISLVRQLQTPSALGGPGSSMRARLRPGTSSHVVVRFDATLALYAAAEGGSVGGAAPVATRSGVDVHVEMTGGSERNAGQQAAVLREMSALHDAAVADGRTGRADARADPGGRSAAVTVLGGGGGGRCGGQVAGGYRTGGHA